MTLFVANISYGASQTDIGDIFEQAECPAESVKLARDPQTGVARGFAFVEIADAETAKRAIATLDGFGLMGRKIRVVAARSQSKRRSRLAPRYRDVCWRELSGRR
jgi:RNA recognition motif-containing protein